MTSSTLRRRSLVTAACTLAVALAYGDTTRPLATTTSATATASAAESGPGGNLFARLPLAFERNDGQFDGRVRFAARGDGYEVALGPTGVQLALVERGAAPREVGVRFLGSRAARTMSGGEALPGLTHYYRGNDPKTWTANVPTFGRVRATGIYPGIDVEYLRTRPAARIRLPRRPRRRPQPDRPDVRRRRPDHGRQHGRPAPAGRRPHDPPAPPGGVPGRRRRAARRPRRLPHPRRPTGHHCAR